MMEAIRSYLTAVVAVSMIAVLASALAHGSRMERVVRFAAGLLHRQNVCIPCRGACIQ